MVFINLTEYVQNLEKEISTLKQKCRALEQRAEDALGEVKVREAVGDNVLVTSHIERLNVEIGNLIMLFMGTANQLLLNSR